MEAVLLWVIIRECWTWQIASKDRQSEYAALALRWRPPWSVDMPLKGGLRGMTMEQHLPQRLHCSHS